MRTTGNTLDRALTALNSLLTQASAIRLTEIGVGWPVAGGGDAAPEIDILAHVEVFGRNHTLVCRISPGGGPEDVRSSLKTLRDQIAFLPGRVTPILIVPVLSPEGQALCEAHGAGCLDLRGNGRLVIDQIFVSMRSLPRRVLHQTASAPAAAPRHSVAAPTDPQAMEAGPGASVLRGFPPAPAPLPNHAVATVAQTRTPQTRAR